MLVKLDALEGAVIVESTHVEAVLIPAKNNVPVLGSTLLGMVSGRQLLVKGVPEEVAQIIEKANKRPMINLLGDN